MNRPKLAIVLVAGALALAGCQTAGPKENVGTLGGAVVGGLIGSQIGDGTGQLLATGIGVAAGAMIGREIGASLDRADRAAMAQANQQALSAPVGQEITWNNPDSGNYGMVKTVRDGRSSAGAYCREYQQDVWVNGELQRAYGTACQQPDGSWQIVGS